MKVAWTLKQMVPHLDEFSAKISTIKLDSATRPCYKICDHLTKTYYSSKENELKKALKTTQIEALETCRFDWLVASQKIAVKAFTINTLYLFELQKDWIHPELKHLITTKIIHESKSTKA